MNIRKILRVIASVLALLFVISFIIPYDPELIYGRQVTANAGAEIITFTKPRPDRQSNKEDKPQTLIEQSDSKVDVIEDNQQEDYISRDKQKMFIILVTGFRTGSTFLGELFNQNPDVFYMFEPFHQNNVNNLANAGKLNGVDSSNTLLEKRTAYLHQIVHGCKAYGFFNGMSLHMRCGTPEENLRRFGSRDCDNSPSKWETACKRRDLVALKLIRLQRIEHLALVPGIEKVNIRVIHLIRDPRGTINSRINYGHFYLEDLTAIRTHPITVENVGKGAGDLCNREWENLKYSDALPEWLKGRYLRITHDEMSLEPIESAKRVYQFIGRPIPPDMNSFLIEHTTVQHKGVLNTSKNSSAILEKWKHLPLEAIREIERQCKNVMDFMGYETFKPPT